MLSADGSRTINLHNMVPAQVSDGMGPSTQRFMTVRYCTYCLQAEPLEITFVRIEEVPLITRADLNIVVGGLEPCTNPPDERVL